MYKREMIVSGKGLDMPYLNAQLRAGRITVDYDGLLYQDLSTDTGLRISHVHAGRFLGGGIHQYHWVNVYKGTKQVFQSQSMVLVYKYLQRHLTANPQGAKHIENGDMSRKLMDVNGNTVGRYDLDEPDED